MKTFAKLILVFTIAFFVSCQKGTTDTPSVYFEKTADSIQNGGIKVIPITTSKGTFKVWTKRIGNNPKIKLLLLNGGPGATHEYFECFENFLPAEGIEIIYYDQLGCGNSDNPNDVALWDLARYVEEVEQVRKALNLDASNFYMLGHSWGGILAMEYALKYQKNMKGLIISNMMSSCPEYGKYAEEVLAKQMDPKVLAEIKQIEAAKDFTNPRYMELLIPNFYEKNILRFPAKDWPEPVNRSFAKMNQSLYVSMQGPSEFGISGKLEKWDRKADLKNITIPTLVIGAKYDTMDPKHMEEMAKLVQNGTYLFCPKGSHMDFYDDQKVYFEGLIPFLKK
ncbi:proline iminopeptidase-family hydrolase [Flavobacterium sp.]|uniref:proline iminopeptidase-family hydrolase n=1 Tax=Flavobacterium sp. TaxID=239 RepID=UPI0008D25C29|nr:proline iminopeptidase-family hydrolase [Flavobacterium sp.]OGS63862.1 MAG: proline iminopeptidase [Flavobacteria bacterium GWA2_35_26]HCF04198.1 proline iminopeptidase [Flavobacterium sp.]